MPAIGEYFRIGRFLALVYPREPRSLEFDRFTRLYTWSSEPLSRPWFAPVIERAWDCRRDRDLRDADVPWLRHYLHQRVDRRPDPLPPGPARPPPAPGRSIFPVGDKGRGCLATVLIVITHVVLEYVEVGGRLGIGLACLRRP